MARRTSSHLSPEKVGKRALRDVREPFVGWVRQEGDDDSTLEAIAGNLEFLLGLILVARVSSAKPVATRFAPAEIDDALHEVIPDLVESFEMPAAAVGTFQDLLHDYLEFLDETGRWTGTVDDFEACHEILHEHSDHEVEVPEEVLDLVAEVGPEEEDAAVLASAAVRAAVSLCRQVRDGFEVEETGDVPQEVYDRAAIDAGRSPGESTTWVVLVWIAVVRTGLVVGVPDAPRLRTSTDLDLAGTSDEARDVRREIVGRLLRDDPTALLTGTSPAAGLMPQLLVGNVLGQPTTRLEVTGTLTALFGDAEAVASVDGIVVGHLERLGVLGLVSDTDPWTIERGFWPALLWGMQTSPEV